MATNDNIQHGIDGSTSGDAEKGAALGGLGGAAVGAAAGALAGPVGAIVGAVAGGLLGAGASGAAVAAVDALDNDNTISGVGDGVTPAATYAPTLTENIRPSSEAPVVGTDVGGHNIVTGEPATSEAGNTGLATGAIVGGLLGTVVGGPVGAVVGGTLGSLAGGVAGDAAEAADDADALDIGAANYDATTPPVVSTGVDTPGSYVSGAANQNIAGQGYAADNNYSGDAFRASAGIGQTPDTDLSPTRDTYSGTTSIGAVDQNADTSVLGGASTPGVRIGNDTPGIQTGGVTTAGTDTRGIAEKAADALTGDHMDDKTGGTVLNEPTTNLADAARNAGNNVEGAVHGVVGDVTSPGNGVPGVQTGGVTTAGADTRGITEKVADALTGDHMDDKTGGITR
ncbi:hypothetical protein IAD21_03215 [Abditibacteriota bacterium]|nr:hypothetical protein IAD21_03215 [Abditibacteriota bacterium]